MKLTGQYNFEPLRFSQEDNRRDLTNYLQSNGQPGRFCGFDCLKGLYSHKDAGVTDWTGFPASGKTYFLLEVLFNLSTIYGLRHMLYVPDLGTYRETVAKLVKMHTGKDFTTKYGNQITFDELQIALPWIENHFLILRKKDIRKPVTPIEFWEYVCWYEDDCGIVHTGSIDSWKNLYHDFKPFGREDLYLDYTLSMRNELAENYKRHFHTIAHATKTEMDDSSDSGGKRRRRIPDANDIKGGGAWYANGKSIITVDFPDKQNTGVDLYISKTKPEDVGRPGSIIGKLNLDIARGRYYEIVDGRKKFAFEQWGTELPNLTPLKDLLPKTFATDEAPF